MAPVPNNASETSAVPRAEPDASAAAERLRELLATARRGVRTLVVGIVNVTPDSFSDGGEHFAPEAAADHAEELIDAGADIIDIGGESTRPATFRTHARLDPAEEIGRILPVIRSVAGRRPDAPISVDTYKASVASAAIEAGAVMVNDISALRADSGMAGVVAGQAVAVCLMHMPGLPMEIPDDPEYADVVTDVRDHLLQRAELAVAAGIGRDRIVVDPGIGFGKTVLQNLELLRRLREIVDLGFPVMVGPSRKSTIGTVLGGLPPTDRVEGTAAAVALSIAGGAALVRVHDVRQMARVARMSDAIARGWQPPVP